MFGGPARPGEPVPNHALSERHKSSQRSGVFVSLQKMKLCHLGWPGVTQSPNGRLHGPKNTFYAQMLLKHWHKLETNNKQAERTLGFDGARSSQFIVTKHILSNRSPMETAVSI